MMPWLATLILASIPCFPLISGQYSNTSTTITIATPVVSSTFSAPTNVTISNGTVNNGGRTLKSYMALGDSFSAGNGAGTLVSPDQPNCRRTSGSYVYQLLNDEKYWEFREHANRFEFNACSGAITSQIQDDQILNPAGARPPFNPFIPEAELYTLSAGGNDLKFDAIVRTCVYNLGTWGSCERNLKAVRASLQHGSDFDLSLAQLYNTLHSRSQPGQVIIVPYIQFYNDQVPSTTFSTKCHVAKEIRQELNKAVTEVNAFILSHTRPYGTSTMLDDASLQSAFDGHRFCDDGGDIWIQDDIFKSLSPAAQVRWNANGTLPADVADALNSTLTQDGQLLSGNATDEDDDNGNVGNIFHPTFKGHTAYYELVAGAILPPVAAAGAASNASATEDNPQAVSL